MSGLDWIVVGVYMAAMLVMSAWLGRHQADERDYYLGNNRMSVWVIAASTMATQCSTNSLLGAPAFVIAVGGLLWLQYELAVPLAMIGVMTWLLPFFRRQGVISVYEYLEKRFGPGSRAMLAVFFQFTRAFSTGVTVYGIGLVIETISGLPFWMAVLLLGAVTVAYDYMGGIRAVVWSDAVQMIIIVVGIVFCLGYAVPAAGGWDAMWRAFPVERMRTLEFGKAGFSEGGTFAFWPMVIGGFFLYLSYYGCDQTQVQRELSTRSVDDTNMSLFLNGILRFPLVLLYCLIGVAIAGVMVLDPGLREAMRGGDGQANFNLAVPAFCLRYLPHGVIGLIIVSLFAAAMSSLDSTINSLSAVTMRDVVSRYWLKRELTGRSAILWPRMTTLFWGLVCVAFSFCVGGVSHSIIESVNKLASLANGPVLAVFLLATLTRRTHDRGVMVAIPAGFVANLLTWWLLPGVSWVWWNVSGCVISFVAGYAISVMFPEPGIEERSDPYVYHRDEARFFAYRRNWGRYRMVLALYFVLMIVVLLALQRYAAGYHAGGLSFDGMGQSGYGFPGGR